MNRGQRLYAAPEIYDAAFNWDTSAERKYYSTLLSRYANLHSRSRLIEFASGTGRILRALDLNRLSLGLDVSPAMTSFARRRTPRDRIEFVVADMATVPARTGSFSAAICALSSISYLHSMRAVEDHLREASRVLTGSGVYIIDFNLGNPRKREEKWETVHEGRHYESEWSIRFDPRKPNEFREEISIRSNGRLLVRNSCSTLMIQPGAFLSVCSRAGFHPVHWFSPFSSKRLTGKLPSGRVFAVLTKQASSSPRSK